MSNYQSFFPVAPKKEVDGPSGLRNVEPRVDPSPGRKVRERDDRVRRKPSAPPPPLKEPPRPDLNAGVQEPVKQEKKSFNDVNPPKKLVEPEKVENQPVVPVPADTATKKEETVIKQLAKEQREQKEILDEQRKLIDDMKGSKNANVGEKVVVLPETREEVAIDALKSQLKELSDLKKEIKQAGEAAAPVQNAPPPSEAPKVAVKGLPETYVLAKRSPEVVSEAQKDNSSLPSEKKEVGAEENCPVPEGCPLEEGQKEDRGLWSLISFERSKIKRGKVHRLCANVTIFSSLDSSIYFISWFSFLCFFWTVWFDRLLKDFSWLLFCGLKP